MCDNFRPCFENLWHLFSFRELKLSLGQQNGIAMTFWDPIRPFLSCPYFDKRKSIFSQWINLASTRIRRNVSPKLSASLQTPVFRSCVDGRKQKFSKTLTHNICSRAEQECFIANLTSERLSYMFSFYVNFNHKTF